MERRAVTQSLLLLLLATPSGALGNSQLPGRRRLFHIARSKNRNLVCYDLLLNPAGHIAEPHPIDVYWELRAEDGRREELSSLERNLAYGCALKGHPKPTELILELTACKSRQLRVIHTPEETRTLGWVAGQAAYLQSLFVQAREGALLPAVDYVEIHATSLDGKTLTERLSP